jgi:serine phosphatase RsbU (regulator of sigma subunit)
MLLYRIYVLLPVIAGQTTPRKEQGGRDAVSRHQNMEKPIMNQDEFDNNKKADILIVDDIPANLNLLCQALEPEGYNVIAAPSGEVALKIAVPTPPDLILLDIMMPGIDGFETCRRLKADATTADIPVIFITAKDEITSIVEGFQVGGVDYITKPFGYEEVRARVKTHLTIKQLQDSLREAKDQLEKAYNQLEADNARKTEELETARVIQKGFLPASVPELSYLDIAAFQKPATEVGGDYYDFFPQEDGKLVLAVGDATGHGVGASLMVSATKTALLTIEEPDLTTKISKMNNVLKQTNSHRLLNMALTLMELSYEANSDTVRVKATGGGMPPIYLLRSNGNVEEIAIAGLPLGAVAGSEYRLSEFQLERTEVLILMSDGLPERINGEGELFGYTQLVSEIKNVGKIRQSASEFLETFVRDNDNWSNNTPQNDDVTLVVLKVKEAC